MAGVNGHRTGHYHIDDLILKEIQGATRHSDKVLPADFIANGTTGTDTGDGTWSWRHPSLLVGGNNLVLLNVPLEVLNLIHLNVPGIVGQRETAALREGDAGVSVRFIRPAQLSLLTEAFQGILND